MADNKHQRQHGKLKIPTEVQKLSKLTMKKYKKEEGEFFENKKELRKAYAIRVADELPAAISFLVKFGHLSEVQEIKDIIYSHITNKDVIKAIKVNVKDEFDLDEKHRYTLLPNLIYTIILSATAYMNEQKAEGEEEVIIDLEDLVNLSKLILKKKIKKLTKLGIDENVAFDILSIIPDTDILKKSQHFHIRQLFNVLYEHAKTHNLNFKKIIDILLKGEEAYKSSVITFALLERKDKISNMNDSQKAFFNNVTEYVLKELEDMSKKDIKLILEAYVAARQRDREKDSPRRYYLSSLPESSYPKVTKQINTMVSNNSDLKKFF